MEPKINVTRLEDGSRYISSIDFYTLIAYVIQGMYNKKIGWSHVEKTPKQWLKDLDQRVTRVSQDALEDMLSTASAYAEDKKFFHPLGYDFNTVIARVSLPDEEYNKMFSIFKKVKVKKEVKTNAKHRPKAIKRGSTKTILRRGKGTRSPIRGPNGS